MYNAFALSENVQYSMIKFDDLEVREAALKKISSIKLTFINFKMYKNYIMGIHWTVIKIKV